MGIKLKPNSYMNILSMGEVNTNPMLRPSISIDSGGKLREL
jgi:hypothetical protein